MEINDYNYEDISVKDVFEFKKTLSLEDIDSYAKLTGDLNPLHCDKEYAKNTKFKNRIIHGMLAGSLFSTLVGMICPGKRSLYLKQSLNFRQPIYPNSELIIKGVVKNKMDSLKIVTLHTEIIANGVVMINGEAQVRVMNDEK